MCPSVFDAMRRDAHENLLFCNDVRTGLRAIIAIHSTALGRGAGGIRMRPYQSETAALHDALNLARAMSYKAALANLPFGGAKCVVLGDPATLKSERLLRSLGRFIERLGGLYLAGEDVGTTQHDMEIIRKETPHVAVLPPQARPGEDGSYATALGVIGAMRACLEHACGSDNLFERRVAVQGLGSVGLKVAQMLAEAGAQVIASDVDGAKTEMARRGLGIEICPPAAIMSVAVDVFSRCALGEVLTEESIQALSCRIICGSANNQLAAAAVATTLHERRILYAPDYVANAGGLICNTDYLQPGGFNRQRALQRTSRIFQTMKIIIEESRRLGANTARTADLLAERRIRPAEPRLE